jgi:hypothetical protein
MKAFVYFNLHRKCWSLKALDGEHAGRVVAHASRVALRNVECRVSEAGRQRVLREQRKNVHAGLVGTVYAVEGEWRIGEAPALPKFDELPLSEHAFAITYNPYKAGTFTRKNDGAAIYGARFAKLDGRDVRVLS